MRHAVHDRASTLAEFRVYRISTLCGRPLSSRARMRPTGRAARATLRYPRNHRRPASRRRPAGQTQPSLSLVSHHRYRTVPVQTTGSVVTTPTVTLLVSAPAQTGPAYCTRVTRPPAECWAACPDVEETSTILYPERHHSADTEERSRERKSGMEQRGGGARGRRRRRSTGGAADAAAVRPLPIGVWAACGARLRWA